MGALRIVLIAWLALVAGAANAVECRDLPMQGSEAPRFYLEKLVHGDDGEYFEVQGFATLIHKDGILITARHLVEDAAQGNLAISAVWDCSNKLEFEVLMQGQPSNRLDGKDWALLYAPQVAFYDRSAAVRYSRLSSSAVKAANILAGAELTITSSTLGPFEPVAPAGDPPVNNVLPILGECAGRDVFAARVAPYSKGDSGAPVVDAEGALIGITSRFSAKQEESLHRANDDLRAVAAWAMESSLPDPAGGSAAYQAKRDELKRRGLGAAALTDLANLIDEMGFVVVTPVQCAIDAVVAKVLADDKDSLSFRWPVDPTAARLAAGFADKDTAAAIGAKTPDWRGYVDLLDAYHRWFLIEGTDTQDSRSVEQAIREAGARAGSDYAGLWNHVEDLLAFYGGSVDALDVQPIAATSVATLLNRLREEKISNALFRDARYSAGELLRGETAILSGRERLRDEYNSPTVSNVKIDVGIAMILWGLSSDSGIGNEGPYFATYVTEIAKALNRKGRTSAGAGAGYTAAAWTIAAFVVQSGHNMPTAWDILSEISVDRGDWKAAWYFASRAAFERCLHKEVCDLSRRSGRSPISANFDFGKCKAYARQALLQGDSQADLLAYVGIPPDLKILPAAETVPAVPVPDGINQLPKRTAAYVNGHTAGRADPFCAPIFPGQSVIITAPDAQGSLRIATSPEALGIPVPAPRPSRI